LKEWQGYARDKGELRPGKTSENKAYRMTWEASHKAGGVRLLGGRAQLILTKDYGDLMALLY
jgi:hypothetical protein